MPSSHLILCHPFSSCPQSFPASESFPMSQLFTWGGQSIRVSASTSVLPVNTQDWSPLGWTGWIPLQSKGLLKVFSSTTVQKNTGVGSLPLLQGIFPTQGLNPGLPHDRWILYQLSHKGSPSSMHSVIFTKFTELRNLPHNGVPERFLKYEFLEMFVHGEKILNSS